jgi:hypothetical protein
MNMAGSVMYSLPNSLARDLIAAMKRAAEILFNHLLASNEFIS